MAFLASLTSDEYAGTFARPIEALEVKSLRHNDQQWARILLTDSPSPDLVRGNQRIY